MTDSGMKDLEGIAIEFFIRSFDGSTPKKPHRFECNRGRGFVEEHDLARYFNDTEWELLMSGPNEMAIVGAGYYNKTYDRGNIIPGSRACRRIVYSRVPDKD